MSRRFLPLKIWGMPVFLVALLALGLPALIATATPLDDYVAAPDPAFSYDAKPTLETKTDQGVVRTYKMISQNWLDESKVSPTTWWHWVTLYIPNERNSTKALLFVDGGSNTSTRPPKADEAMNRIAIMTKSMVVVIKQIPNQPLKFVGEMMEKYKKTGRSEDAQIAYGWDKFLVTGDPLWLARLPMTKAVVRAMDLAQKEEPATDGFFVVGGSKRGWTTWTVAAVDKRVIGIAPASIDVLNVEASLANHHAAYGFWAPAVGNYEEMKILDRLHTPEFRAMMAIVDPISYAERLTMPKYIVNSAGDQFFPSDSSKFYFDDLRGEKYVRYLANTDHGLSLEAYMNLTSFYYGVINDTPRPKFSWSINADGSLTIDCETVPKKVRLWQASNLKARDFRMEEIGKVWKSVEVTLNAAGSYQTNVDTPEEGWTAFFLELSFNNPGFPLPYKFTTGISILPQVLPHTG